jgi:hypothetical protein
MLNPDRVSNILFLHAGALGDFVLALHVVAAARRRFGHLRIDGVVRCPLAKWAARQGVLETACDPDSIGAHALHAEPARADSPIARLVRDSDLVLSFLGEAYTVVGQNLQSLCCGRSINIGPTASAGALLAGRHITEQWRRDIASAGLALDVASRPLFRREGDAGREPSVIVHPGSGGRSKCCPLAVLEAAVRRLRDGGRRVSWMIGPVETDLYGQGYAAKLAETAPVIYEESIDTAADHVRGAAAFIGNDAGMTHLAAACGVKTVAVFGPTDPAVWCPLGPNVEVAQFDFEMRGVNACSVAQRIVDAACGP